ncbi:hypothetical protein ACQQCD_04910 [Pseudarthrobacter sp. J1763]|uniref:hypothetical protein n=1 Tax=Pseudarthrobacter sp. J1763 TaxID=3420445 RepID=UPI003D28107F
MAAAIRSEQWTLVGGLMVTKIAGREPFQIEGGTQALRRTVNALLTSAPGETTKLSVPNLHGALVLKGAAYMTDSRDKGRHLEDAAVLCACIQDPYAIVAELGGSDRQRFAALYRALEAPTHQAWTQLEDENRIAAHDVLRILASGKTPTALPPIGHLGEFS